VGAGAITAPMPRISSTVVPYNPIILIVVLMIETNTSLDWVLGGLALLILLGGLWMLFSGVGSMGDKP
jgi:hypothetical protein